MIKELLLAITLGAILGFGVTGAFFALNKNKTVNKNQTIQVSPTPTITDLQMSTQISTTPSETPNKSSINITSPEKDSILSNSKVSLKGDTKPNSVVVISTPSKTFSGKANANGVFNISIELDSGLNPIKISSIDPQDNQDQTEINLTYSTAKI